MYVLYVWYLHLWYMFETFSYQHMAINSVNLRYMFKTLQFLCLCLVDTWVTDIVYGLLGIVVYD